MLRHRRTIVSIFGLAAALSGTPATAMPGKVSATNPGWSLCEAAVARQEARRNIPRGLMHAIARVESGQWESRRRAKVAWPWTINAAGNGRYLPTKNSAAAEIRRLQRQGIRSIDVGCMQVNLMHHPKAFRTLEQALDPGHNAAYAAEFLVSLKRAHGSWKQAVQHYHSTTPMRQKPYLRKVYDEWRKTTPQSRSTAVRPATRPVAATAKGRKLKRAARRVDRAHRMKLSAYRNNARNPGRRLRTAKVSGRAPAKFLSKWPPRGVKAQRRAQNLARSWAYNRRK
jgi:hypothetical protein